MSTVLVTGGAGFIGSHVVDRLLAEGLGVRVLDDLSSGRRANLPEAAVLFEGCICDEALVAEAMTGVSEVVHLAAQVSVPRSVEDPRTSYRLNVGGTMTLLEAARREGVHTFTFAASSAAYGDHTTMPLTEDLLPRPLSPYASGKVAGEHLMRVWAHSYGLHTTALRFFNIFGPRQVDDSPYTGVIAIFARALLEGRVPTIFGDGQQTRDFTYVSNVVEAIRASMRGRHQPGQVLNVGCGESITLVDLLQAMGDALGTTIEPTFGPVRAGDVQHSLADPTRAREVLDWVPGVPWREGLKLTLDWYRERISAEG